MLQVPELILPEKDTMHSHGWTHLASFDARAGPRDLHCLLKSLRSTLSWDMLADITGDVYHEERHQGFNTFRSSNGGSNLSCRAHCIRLAFLW